MIEIRTVKLVTLGALALFALMVALGQEEAFRFSLTILAVLILSIRRTTTLPLEIN